MSQVGWSNAVSLIPLLAGLTFGSEVLNKSVCQGDSIQLFNRSIQINTSDTIVYLFKNGDTYIDIAEFTSDGNRIDHNNMVMDFYNYLWIINVHSTDKGSYILQTDFRNGETSNITTYLSVLVAPNTTCKPVIKRRGNTLTARLPNTSCGDPVASAYFRDCSGNICEDTNIRTLQAGREAGTYYACITGPALRCARSSDPSSDYCSFFQIVESSDDGKDEWLIAIVSLEVVLLLTVIIFGSHGCYIHNKLRSTRNPKRNSNDKDSPEEENIPLQVLPQQLDS